RVFVIGEVAVGLAPVGNGPRDAVNELLDAPLALGSAVLAIKILADDDVGSELAPRGRDFGVLLLEHQLAVLVLDLSRAQLPLDRVTRIGDVGRTEFGVNFQPFGELPNRVHFGTTVASG